MKEDTEKSLILKYKLAYRIQEEYYSKKEWLYSENHGFELTKDSIAFINSIGYTINNTVKDIKYLLFCSLED